MQIFHGSKINPKLSLFLLSASLNQVVMAEIEADLLFEDEVIWGNSGIAAADVVGGDIYE